MTHINRNIGITIRHKTYVFAQSFAAENHLTTSDFIKSLMLFKDDYLIGMRERKKEVFESLEELKIAGRILNIHTKQINSNMKNRNHVDDGLYNDLFNIINRAISAYKYLRFHDNELLIANLILSPSVNFKKKNKRNLKRRVWQFFKLNLNEDEHAQILKKVEHYKSELPKLTVNKYANLCLGVSQNQNGFDAKFTSSSIKKVSTQLTYIIVNAAQIVNNVRKNAQIGEIKVAQKIREKANRLKNELHSDPAIYPGYRFSNHYYSKTKLKLTKETILS